MLKPSGVQISSSPLKILEFRRKFLGHQIVLPSYCPRKCIADNLNLPEELGKTVPDEIVLTGQRFEIINSGITYSYFLGGLDAKKLKKISDAPSFEYQTPNEQIAAEVLVL